MHEINIKYYEKAYLRLKHLDGVDNFDGIQSLRFWIISLAHMKTSFQSLLHVPVF